MYISSEASCTVYKAALQNYNLPGFTPNFITGLSTLKTDEKAYFAFIQNFGTHYV